MQQPERLLVIVVGYVVLMPLLSIACLSFACMFMELTFLWVRKPNLFSVDLANYQWLDGGQRNSVCLSALNASWGAVY